MPAVRSLGAFVSTLGDTLSAVQFGALSDALEDHVIFTVGILFWNWETSCEGSLLRRSRSFCNCTVKRQDGAFLPVFGTKSISGLAVTRIRLLRKSDADTAWRP
jgi:hypothetical protein